MRWRAHGIVLSSTTTNLSLIAIGRDEDQLNVFVREETASAWFTEHDPEGVPFEHPVYAA
jgi:hypothetical protein